MKVFEMKEVLKRSGYVQASHKWGLPGVKCPVCHQTWSNIGLEYPSVDLSDLPQRKLYAEPRAEPLQVFLELKMTIQKAFPRLRQLPPGTRFGPLQGTATGELDGFVWNMPWTLLITGNALNKLRTCDISLPATVPPVLKFKKEPKEMYEFEILPAGNLLNGIPTDGTEPCSGCGRVGVTLPKKLIVDHSSVPTNKDVFRLSNFTTIILVTERLAKVVNKLKIEGAFFEEVELA